MDIEHIHPELRAAVSRFPVLPMHRRVVPMLLNLMMGLRPRARLLPGVRVTDVRQGQVRVRVYRPEAAHSGAALLWIHGGGLIIGNAAINDRECAAFASELGLVVVSTEYRLAPRHRYPAALNDCYAAWRWLQAQAGALGIDPARVAIAGQSAGGGLAASLALRIRAAGGTQPAAQVLLCPMLDDRTGARRDLDRRQHLLWNNRSNRAAWSWYLGKPAGSPDVPACAAAARCADLAELPPTWIGVGEVDLFHEEDTRYAERLVEAGVSCELHIAPMAPHGFEVVAFDSGIARAYFASCYGFLRRTLQLGVAQSAVR